MGACSSFSQCCKIKLNNSFARYLYSFCHAATLKVPAPVISESFWVNGMPPGLLPDLLSEQKIPRNKRDVLFRHDREAGLAARLQFFFFERRSTFFFERMRTQN
jgi:hypothetical protein